ncbi:hypothetical protein [Campylobacter geochelonis]|uniref:Fic family protein n=1 Tax=Campylobacter geochelonis TaxID=1780362 RepID=A0A128EDW1_9BACT|nr:hypothetical protein [Campylobacter geochelonis]QKF70386.1 Fic domain-containing protein [Campylobacter geochelonis]CZE46393.1 Uncharacterised protein [Campylobacter geochelonis]
MSIYENLLNERKNGVQNGLYHYIQIIFSYNSNKINGNKLSQVQTSQIYENNSFGINSAQIIKVNDILDIKSHFLAFDFILDNVDILDTKFIKEVYKKLRYFDDEICSCQESTKDLLNELVFEYNAKKNINLNDIIEFYYKFQCIKPYFKDSGRLGRLLMFKECLRAGITPFIIDEENMTTYLQALADFECKKFELIDTCMILQEEFAKVAEKFQS